VEREPLHHLARIERLGEVVVGAQAGAAQDVGLRGLGGEHHDRHLPAVLGLPQLREHLEAVLHGHHHVEHDAMRALGESEREGLPPVLGLDDLPPFELEHGSQHLPDRGVVVDHQRPQPVT
jgi:hypothetical protein